MIDGQCLVSIFVDKSEPCDPFTADINQDGAIDLFDYLLMVDTIVSHIK